MTVKVTESWKPEKELLEAYIRALVDWRDYVIMRSQEYVPVSVDFGKTRASRRKTAPGSLKRSMEVTIDQDTEKEISYGELFGVDYAEYVEYGTDRMIRAHGEHDPKHPVTSWEAKRKRGAHDSQQMPYLRPAFYEANSRLEGWVKKHIARMQDVKDP